MTWVGCSSGQHVAAARTPGEFSRAEGSTGGMFPGKAVWLYSGNCSFPGHVVPRLGQVQESRTRSCPAPGKHCPPPMALVGDRVPLVGDRVPPLGDSRLQKQSHCRPGCQPASRSSTCPPISLPTAHAAPPPTLRRRAKRAEPSQPCPRPLGWPKTRARGAPGPARRTQSR